MYIVNCHSRSFDFMLPYGGEPIDVRDNSWEYFFKGRLYTFVITDKSAEPADDKLKERVMTKDDMER